MVDRSWFIAKTVKGYNIFNFLQQNGSPAHQITEKTFFYYDPLTMIHQQNETLLHLTGLLH